MQLSDMRVVDLQRLDIRKRFCNVITDKKEIENHIKHIILMKMMNIKRSHEGDLSFIL